MEWNEILTEKLLGDKAPGLLKTFLLTEMPAFTAPVDPAAWSLRAAELRKKALAEVYLRGWPAAQPAAGIGCQHDPLARIGASLSFPL